MIAFAVGDRVRVVGGDFVRDLRRVGTVKAVDGERITAEFSPGIRAQVGRYFFAPHELKRVRTNRGSAR